MGSNTHRDTRTEEAGRKNDPCAGRHLPQAPQDESSRCSPSTPEHSVLPNPMDYNSSRIVEYYDAVAPAYDQDRFDNPYGGYINTQERRILTRWLAPSQPGPILDLACGTGRFLDLATHGLDISSAMVDVARRKHPTKSIYRAPAQAVGNLGVSFRAIFCLHTFMHLSKTDFAAIVQACHECLAPGGLLIFDYPSALRRRITGYRPATWHAGTAFTTNEILKLTAPAWRFGGTHGLLFFPIHRIPAHIRFLARPFDDLIGTTPAKLLCSYLLMKLERQ